MQSSQSGNELPEINAALIGGFRVFNRRYLRKHFHALGVQRQALQQASISSEDSLVVYGNHASWWDPLIALYMAESLFSDWRMFAPIDAKAFEKYRIFARMGFFPVDQQSLRGAGNFLRTSRRILAEKASSIWITPEGRFADVRDSSAALMPGLAHLAAELAAGVSRDSHRVWFLPAAVEYVFWEERLPEVLIWFGQPLLTSAANPDEGLSSAASKAEWQRRLTRALREAQAQLAEQSIARNSAAFEVLLRSRSGTFFLYDWWRGLTNGLRGRRFQADHSDLLRD